ncbi:uncharacterized protein [Watersipora subatra]|uniref:uncharacterized protein n=1 Tax=Watersipora subatra TaxID=2589382 RepID=UPI00355AF427
MEGILSPQQLDLRCEDLSGEWRCWQRAFSDYLLAIDLTGTTKAAEKRKLALFRHAGGEDVREVYSQIEFKSQPDDDGNTGELEEGAAGRKLDDVIKRFHEYCNLRPGVVVGRFKFHNSSQGGDTVDVFLIKLRQLAEGCQFGDQRDSLIQDKLLSGLGNTKERDKLMRESNEKLSLDYVIKSLRIADKSGKWKHQKAEEKSEDVNAVSQFSREKLVKSAKHGFSKQKCENCGKNHNKGQRCPAYGSQCKRCQKFNHWAVMCRQDTHINETEAHDVTEEVYLGEVNTINAINSSMADSWYADLRVHTNAVKSQRVRFKLDTEAALSVCGPNQLTGGFAF